MTTNNNFTANSIRTPGTFCNTPLASKQLIFCMESGLLWYELIHMSSGLNKAKQF